MVCFPQKYKSGLLIFYKLVICGSPFYPIFVQNDLTMASNTEKKQPTLAETPKPPYYAVIFSTTRTEGDNGYGEMAEKMAQLAATMPGYLGAESTRNEIGITVSYWKDLESIKNWKYQMEHVEARDLGREVWYQSYRLRIAKVERDYGFEKR